MDEVRFSDKVAFSMRHANKSLGLSVKNLVSSIKSIDMLSRGDLEHWTYTRGTMSKRRYAKKVHVKLAKMAITKL